eukprot:m.492758 g.492758  ORF g.492758 m.492758 type:complete len:385 (-) comp34009_c0_seq1:142-1296(-)
MGGHDARAYTAVGWDADMHPAGDACRAPGPCAGLLGTAPCISPPRSTAGRSRAHPHAFVFPSNNTYRGLLPLSDAVVLHLCWHAAADTVVVDATAARRPPTRGAKHPNSVAPCALVLCGSCSALAQYLMGGRTLSPSIDVSPSGSATPSASGSSVAAGSDTVAVALPAARPSARRRSCSAAAAGGVSLLRFVLPLLWLLWLLFGLFLALRLPLWLVLRSLSLLLFLFLLSSSLRLLFLLLSRLRGKSPWAWVSSRVPAQRTVLNRLRAPAGTKDSAPVCVARRRAKSSASCSRCTPASHSNEINTRPVPTTCRLSYTCSRPTVWAPMALVKGLLGGHGATRCGCDYWRRVVRAQTRESADGRICSLHAPQPTTAPGRDQPSPKG